MTSGVMQFKYFYSLKILEVMKLDFNENKNLFSKTTQIKNIECAPLSIYKTYQNNDGVLDEVNKWFK